ncbi:MAG TPA: hypothetical protein VLA72_19555 [Anaerolineales bacterium]|nr:hypothetical protein [Anaerolineales bacterium]
MSKTEVKPITVQVLDLQSGEAVDSANVTHAPLSGNAKTITPTIETPYINMVFGPFDIPGRHFVAVGDATSPSKPEVLYSIEGKDY